MKFDEALRIMLDCSYRYLGFVCGSDGDCRGYEKVLQAQEIIKGHVPQPVEEVFEICMPSFNFPMRRTRKYMPYNMSDEDLFSTFDPNR